MARSGRFFALLLLASFSLAAHVAVHHSAFLSLPASPPPYAPTSSSFILPLKAALLIDIASSSQLSPSSPVAVATGVAVATFRSRHKRLLTEFWWERGRCVLSEAEDFAVPTPSSAWKRTGRRRRVTRGGPFLLSPRRIGRCRIMDDDDDGDLSARPSSLALSSPLHTRLIRLSRSIARFAPLCFLCVSDLYRCGNWRCRASLSVDFFGEDCVVDPSADSALEAVRAPRTTAPMNPPPFHRPRSLRVGMRAGT